MVVSDILPSRKACYSIGIAHTYGWCGAAGRVGVFRLRLETQINFAADNPNFGRKFSANSIW